MIKVKTMYKSTYTFCKSKWERLMGTETEPGAIDRKYLEACARIGVADTTETRVFISVAVVVGLFYILYVAVRLLCFFAASASTLMAIVNQ